jgi:hypothetical protein
LAGAKPLASATCCAAPPASEHQAEMLMRPAAGSSAVSARDPRSALRTLDEPSRLDDRHQVIVTMAKIPDSVGLHSTPSVWSLLTRSAGNVFSGAAGLLRKLIGRDRQGAQHVRYPWRQGDDVVHFSYRTHGSFAASRRIGRTKLGASRDRPALPKPRRIARCARASA